MLPRLAQAIESLFGEALRPAASLLRATAQVALVAAVTFSFVRVARTLRAFRLGWENALVVRCPRCRRLVADPDLRTCPSGHPIQFPSGASDRELRRRRFHRLSRVAASSAFVVPVLIALGAAAGFRMTGVARMEGPLASLTASFAYLFLAAALALAGLAASPRCRSWPERALHAATSILCLFPALLLSVLARGFEPPQPRTIGHLWSTPTALYVSSGGRPHRVGEPASEIDAELIDVRAPALGIVWEGLARFRAGDRVVEWRGRGGTLARLFERWAAPLSRRGVFLQRTTRSLFLPPNVRMWIVSEPGRIRFGSAGDFDLARPAKPPRGLLRRTG
jgi:hypothetical protein